VLGIVTNSLAPGEPKDPGQRAPVRDLPRVRIGTGERGDAQGVPDGIAWGEAKQRVFERIDSSSRRCACATRN
jgi:tryptophanyl-tRNA synthetase